MLSGENPRDKWDWLHAIKQILAYSIGGLLLWSAVVHILNIDGFALSIMKYELFGPVGSLLLSRFLPVAMALSATCLFIGDRKIGHLLAVAIFASFALALAWALANGIDINCGCALRDSAVDQTSLVKPISLFAIAVIGASYEAKSKFK